jgi:hypothetical protein
MGRLTGGKFKLFGKPLVTDPASGPISPYTKPQQAPSDTGVLPSGA